MSKEKNIQFIFEVMQMKLNHLYEASNFLDQKISTFLGFTATLMAGLMIFFKDNLELSLCPFTTNFFTIGLFSIFFSIFFAMINLSTKKYYYPPHEDQLYSDESLNLKEFDLKSQIIADMREGFTQNHRKHEDKAKIFNYSLAFLIFGLFLILINLL